MSRANVGFIGLNYKPETLTNYRYQLRRFGRLLESIAPRLRRPNVTNC
jgi:hypothetical protein